MVGLYIIKNTTNNKIYVGRSVDLLKTIKEIKNQLKSNKYKVLQIQLDFNKGDNFTFSTHKCLNHELNRQKYMLISKHNTSNPKFGYNQTLPNNWRNLVENGYFLEPVFAEVKNDFSDLDKIVTRLDDLRKYISTLKGGKL